MAIDNYMDDDDLVYNISSRIPVCLCLDTSGSMRDCDDTNLTRIERVKEGINKLYEELRNNDMTVNSAEVGIICFSDEGYLVKNFKTLTDEDDGMKLNIFPHGKGDIGAGVLKALEELQKRKESYKQNGVDYYQPWLIIMTDGHTTGEGQVRTRLSQAQNQVLKLEKDKKITVIPVYIGGDLSEDEKAQKDLSGFSEKNSPQSQETTKFSDFFEWLGKSVSIDTFKEEQVIDFSDLEDWDEI